ncbi:MULTISPECIES: RNA polymerase sigma factor [Brevundimonas]|uniref:RNA polymerase sigma factor n=1 Tax=Brevundimonas TaxID=41275 RepID=UPI001F0CA504|nr:RNA polymerase sigma factor [Brevundimonas lutea]
MGAGDTEEAKAAQGDRAAFSRLMTATKGDLHRFVARYVGDPDEALDLVQESYAAAWLSIRRYDPARPFGAWLRTIALNKCRDWSRRRRVRRMVRGVMGLDAPQAMAVGDPAPGADVRVDERRRLERLNRALADLPGGQRAPLMLAVLEGRSHAEIGEILGLSPKAVELRIARARRALLDRIGPFD